MNFKDRLKTEVLAINLPDSVKNKIFDAFLDVYGERYLKQDTNGNKIPLLAEFVFFEVVYQFMLEVVLASIKVKKTKEAEQLAVTEVNQWIQSLDI